MLPRTPARMFCPVRWLPLALLAALGLGSAPLAETTSTTVPLKVPSDGRPGFSTIDPQVSGLRFTNVLAEARSLTNQIYLNGSGVAAADLNGDGLPDVVVTGLDVPNALFLNLGGGRFSRQTDSGLELPGEASTGVVLVDLNADGHRDAVINTVGGGTWILWNNGTGRFQSRPDSRPLNPGRGGMSIAVADVDRDGDLDLYLVNYRRSTFRDEPNTRFSYAMDAQGQPVLRAVNGVPVTDPAVKGRFTSFVTADGRLERIENGEPDRLYLNDGRGGFTPVAWTEGAFRTEEGLPLSEEPMDWGLATMFADLNGDGLSDLYVANDFASPDRIWLNVTPVGGPVQFRAAPRLALRHTSFFSMGLDVADVNRDGHDDVFVLDMRSRSHARRMVDLGPAGRPRAPRLGAIDDRPQANRNTLQLARGDGTFAEIAEFAGLDASEWAWTPVFLDVDLDGWEDLLVTTGQGRDYQHADHVAAVDQQTRGRQLPVAEQLRLRSQLPVLALTNLAFRNQRDLTFAEVGSDWGFTSSGVSHGMALADLDGDGDADVLINRLNDGLVWHRNESSAPRLRVDLRGPPANADGIGSRLRVSGGPVVQTQTLRSGGRYLSSDEPFRVFAAGTADARLTVEVTWPDGATDRVEGIPANSRLILTPPPPHAPRSSPSPSTEPRTLPLFTDRSEWLNHVHHEAFSEDFTRQTTLPESQGQLGPGVAWVDLDGDGREELVLGTGAGGAIEVRTVSKAGPWPRFREAWPKAPGDVLAMLGLKREPGSPVVWFTQADAAGTLPSRLWGGPTALPGPQIEGGRVLAATDLDGDGHLELFVGGTPTPGRYPESTGSQLLRSSAGGWQVDPANSATLASLVRVQGAVFSDLNDDGWPDLVATTDWGPVRIFLNERGTLRERTIEWGLEPWTGRWRGVATGDFDGDGRMDLVTANWGLNAPQAPSLKTPRRLRHGPGAEPGTVEIVEAWTDSEGGRVWPVRRMSVLSTAWPDLPERFPTQAAYAAADVDTILGETPTDELQTVTWASTLWLNRGDRLERHPLPAPAQWAPASAVVVADFDGDGFMDAFLSQNFFAVRPEDTRLDAGRGLWLRGDGRGGLTPVDGAESGIRIYGDQRAAATADFDADGRLDLVVTQNAATTVLLHNTGAKPGLRVRLVGPPGNPTALGAAVRIRGSGPEGPWTEVQAGSGYLGQNGATLVIARSGAADPRLEIRWPGGRTSTVGVPAAAAEIRVTQDGSLEVIR